jgi:hypothetical protein
LRPPEGRAEPPGEEELQRFDSSGAANGYSYHANGELKSMKLPSGRQIDYGITTGGRIGSVTGTLNPVPVTCASAVSYAAHGAATVIESIPPRGAGGRMKAMKNAARSNGRLELPLPGSPPSPLGRKLMRLRKKIEASGVKLLTRAEVDREVLRRRGLA